MGVKRKSPAGQLITIEVAIVTKYSEEEQGFYAWSPRLQCMRDGDTVEEALVLCREALEVLFESLLERGTLRQYLSEHGYEELLVEANGKQGVLYALQEGNLIPPGLVPGTGTITSAPYGGMYKERFHPQRSCVRA